jgi:MATE family multidrug resistance protein
MFSAAAGYIAMLPQPYAVFRGLRRPAIVLFRELFRVGWPIGMTLGFEAGLFSVVAVLMGLFGTEALAAHQIAQQSVSTTFMIPVGLSTATAVRVGHAVGRGDREGVGRAAVTGIVLASLVMIATAILFWRAPRVVIGLFLGADVEASEVVRQASVFLAIAASFQIFDGIQVTALGALRGLRDTRFPMIISLFSYWGIGVPVGVALAFWLGFRGSGLWVGLVFGLGTAAILLVLRLRRRLRGDDLSRLGAAAGGAGPDGSGMGPG